MERGTGSFSTELLGHSAHNHWIPPAKLLFNRDEKTLLPELRLKTSDDLGEHHRLARIRDEKQKEKMARYASTKSQQAVGTAGWRRGATKKNTTSLRNKMTPAYFPQELPITRKKGTRSGQRGKMDFITNDNMNTLEKHLAL